MHQASGKYRIANDASSVGHGQERHPLGLQVSGNAGIGQGSDVGRTRAIRGGDRHEIVAHFQRCSNRVEGAGTAGLFVPISQAPALAGLINWMLGGRFDLGGGDQSAWTSIFGGTVYSAFNGAGQGVVIDQRVDWYGTLYAFDTVDLAYHSRYIYVPFVPEPSSLTLAGLAAAAFGFFRRKCSKQQLVVRCPQLPAAGQGLR